MNSTFQLQSIDVARSHHSSPPSSPSEATCYPSANLQEGGASSSSGSRSMPNHGSGTSGMGERSQTSLSVTPPVADGNHSEGQGAFLNDSRRLEPRFPGWAAAQFRGSVSEAATRSGDETTSSGSSSSGSSVGGSASSVHESSRVLAGGGGSRELELREKAVSAAGAAVLSAIIMNPLDVAKTRLQAQAAGVTFMSNGNSGSGAMSGASWNGFHSSLLRHHPAHVLHARVQEQALAYTGTLDVMRKVSSQEGFARLWRGTNAALLIAVPTVGIYLPLYDVLRDWLSEGNGLVADGHPTRSSFAPYAPLVAGSISRGFAVVICSPLELARTRMQAQKQVLHEAPRSISRTLRDVIGTASSSSAPWRRVGLLWTGVDAQLARDVPFSAICWASLEAIRRPLLAWAGPDANGAQVFGANFCAGVMAGGFAAAATHPLDIAKTRRQIETDPVKGRGMSLFRTLSQVYREQGTKGLFTGLTPRAARAAPSTGLVVSFYEVVKYVMRRHGEGGGGTDSSFGPLPFKSPEAPPSSFPVVPPPGSG
eukprot:TRINITY_DN26721_c0_g1_i1.p1 TRINITY_DN26721_c0_g1~~TRINITY_DN26721_c0_g1_i1.p1  ORF type:complete len:538 (+),score=82.70 TRINITY_DN26721_c0_g1_i1:171-1784(+)